MDRLIYTAYTGMSASMIQQRVIANNMANAQTTGFRAELFVATPTTVKGTGLEARAMTDGQVHGASMSQGDLEQTGNPLDVALTGDTMLAVQDRDGTEVYTRRGDLSVDAGGTLVNGDGLPVLSDNGPITVPEGVKLSIQPDGTVMAADPAQANAPPEAIGKLKMAATVCSGSWVAACCPRTMPPGWSAARSKNPTSTPPKCWSTWCRPSACSKCAPKSSPAPRTTMKNRLP
jgi:flagellar basal-body rod protein FlgF